MRKIVLPIAAVALLAAALCGCRILKKSAEESSKNQTDKTAEISMDKSSDKSQDTLDAAVSADEKNKEAESIESSEKSADGSLGDGYESGKQELEKEEAARLIKGGKQAMFAVFTSGDMSKYDSEKNYVPVKSELNSPEKMEELLGRYFTRAFADEFMEKYVGIKYVDGVYSIPLGNIGMWPDYDGLKLEKVEQIDDHTVEAIYQVPTEVDMSRYEVQFKYEDGLWRISGDSPIIKNH